MNLGWGVLIFRVERSRFLNCLLLEGWCADGG